MDISIRKSMEELTKEAQRKGSDPFVWAIQMYSSLSSSGESLPSSELAEFLVSYICWDNNVPIIWKFLDMALIHNMVPPMFLLALLSVRVIPCRHVQPAAYRLYLELIKMQAFQLKSLVERPDYQKVMKSVDGVLRLSQIFGMSQRESGNLVVEFIFSIVWQLLDASLGDEGLLEFTPDKKCKWAMIYQEMELDGHNNYGDTEHKERLRNTNTLIAIELIGRFLQDKISSKILCLARKNLPAHWLSFVQRLQLLGANSSALKNSKTLSPKTLMDLTSDTCMVLSQECKTTSQKKFSKVMGFEYLSSAASLFHGTTHSALWIPLDLVLEDTMDGYQVSATSAVEEISGLIKTLRAINGTSWYNTFLGLWFASLRLVQRERDPIEGPMPHLDTRLCMLLCIIPLVVANLVEEEEEEQMPVDENGYDRTDHRKEERVPGKCRHDLVSSLRVLGDYQSLLTPPQSVTSAANQAAAKAMLFISGVTVGSAYFDCLTMAEMPVDCSGNMRHLIVEACIARNLLDTSAYEWPGYVNGQINQIPQCMPTQVPGWSSFMKGAPLTSVMVNALVSSPATSLAELEKIFEIAIAGSEDEKISAATILCGASLIRGWNIQEHTVHFILRLLSPPVPVDNSEGNNYLINYAPILNALFIGIAPIDCVQVFSLHGLVPQLACSLMPICEVFGSCMPNISWKLTSGEEISAHAVFSNVFILLLKLWKFNCPPLEHGIGDAPTVGSQLTPEYLLLVRNSHLLSDGNNRKNSNRRRLSEIASLSSPNSVFVDSFPKLKVWYRQHQACIASTLSGLVHGTPFHQIVEGLLNMMFKKINRGNQASLASGSSSSSGPGNDDASTGPKLPAWDILEAIPFVVDAALTACAHGRLSPRELATGLKDLADFLPASLATIVSYFSAEVTRGVWKPAFMNGTDWPSPAANLQNVEEQIKKILAETGVDVPSLTTGDSSPATLPLPLAAFTSLTITYKVDRSSERFLHLAGQTLEGLAAGCPWPCMPIVASLWTQKARRWSDFLIFSASRTVFLHNSDAVVQLVKSCFTATLGMSSSSISCSGGVGALLGHGFKSNLSGRICPVAPGILYLRAYRSVRDIVFLTEEIVSILMQSVREIVCDGQPKQPPLKKFKPTKDSAKYGQVSLASAMTKVKLAGALGASLVWISGGLALVQLLINETLPSWFISNHRSDQEEKSNGMVGMVAMLGGYGLAYFAVLCGAFAWGVDSSSSASKRRQKVLGTHMEFLASALDGKISLGCDPAIWRAYVSGFVSLMVNCTPNWVLEVDVLVLKRLSKGLRRLNEEGLALTLLGAGGVGTMGAAAELIIDTGI
ncbi:mediator of RNA polymerase II transcription subunit 33A [Lathyrus oleraceus]|uniref:Mediator of RNA polymerase II transcription subunit 33A n=2 Tax=Pisum sativum TaxID=3888 RepID=A0A9D5H033_PEA|nr:mediator of RNA polymerase II transcription subunit 33A [Pisum sativum]KAI5447317.1 Mediator of RNA polymerase II transcription subunit 33A [Pisum sativum]